VDGGEQERILPPPGGGGHQEDGKGRPASERRAASDRREGPETRPAARPAPGSIRPVDLPPSSAREMSARIDSFSFPGSADWRQREMPSGPGRRPASQGLGAPIGVGQADREGGGRGSRSDPGPSDGTARGPEGRPDREGHGGRLGVEEPRQGLHQGRRPASSRSTSRISAPRVGRTGCPRGENLRREPLDVVQGARRATRPAPAPIRPVKCSQKEPGGGRRAYRRPEERRTVTPREGKGRGGVEQERCTCPQSEGHRISATGSSVRETRIVSPIPSSRSDPIPMAD